MQRLWAVVLILGLLLEGCSSSSYKVVVASRDVSFGPDDTTDFSISPAQVQIDGLKVGQSVTLTVNIVNKLGDMDYTIAPEQPPNIVKGYEEAVDSDYKYSLSSSSLEIDSQQTATLTVVITKEVGNASKQEKGFVITQVPKSSSAITLAHAEIFEILLP
jgi:PBP1b-binding outer membrane lipoprotein LpoB